MAVFLKETMPPKGQNNLTYWGGGGGGFLLKVNLLLSIMKF